MARYFIENERRANSQIVDVIFRRVLGGGDYDVGLGRRNASGKRDRRRQGNAHQVR